MTHRFYIFAMLAVLALLGCQATVTPSIEPRRVCGLANPATCDAIFAQVSSHAGLMTTPPVTVLVPEDPDGLEQRGGDFPVLVGFATFDRAQPVTTWLARKVAFTSGMAPTDWTVERWEGPLPDHLIAALRRAQGEAGAP